MDNNDHNMNSRREILKKLLKGAGAMYVGGSVWGGFVKSAKGNKLVLRPPGALEEEEFLKACTKCGICIEVCPYDTLVVSSFKESTLAGTPSYKPREIPCYMCPDVPCTNECPTTALDITRLHGDDLQADINNSRMGIAVVDINNCIAHWGIQCDACYRACPKIDKAIIQEYTRDERTGVHARLTPKVNSEACTGCGICEHVCITESPSIRIFPRDIALGEAGEHYIRGWDEQDEKRVNPNAGKKEIKSDDVPAEDYLNNWEDLVDD